MLFVACSLGAWGVDETAKCMDFFSTGQVLLSSFLNTCHMTKAWLPPSLAHVQLRDVVCRLGKVTELQVRWRKWEVKIKFWFPGGGGTVLLNVPTRGFAVEPAELLQRITLPILE